MHCFIVSVSDIRVLVVKEIICPNFVYTCMTKKGVDLRRNSKMFLTTRSLLSETDTYMKREHVLSITFYCKSFFSGMSIIFMNMLWPCNHHYSVSELLLTMVFQSVQLILFGRISYFLLLLFVVSERAVLD